MKKIILSLTGIILLSYTPRAHAALSPLCQAALASLPSVSFHYTSRVLERARLGIAYAASAPADTDFLRYLAGWIRVVGSTVVSLIDTDLRIVRHAKDLTENTACLRVDLFLIECKMDEVREELNQAIHNQSFRRIMRLESLILFLNERYRTIVEGAHDLYYEDPGWHRSYIFDDPTGPYVFAPRGTYEDPPLCGNGVLDTGEECDGSIGCSAACQNDMCPFHSDYLPPSPTGFGCDESVMALMGGHPPTVEELAGLGQAAGTLQNFITQMQAIFTLQTQIDELLGRNTPVSSVPDRQHRPHPLNGCMQSVCSDVRYGAMTCTQNEDCRNAGLGSCVSSARLGTCLDNPAQTCTDDTYCADGCVQLTDTAWWELRGPFAIEKDEPRIMDVFRERREYEGEGREFPDDWKFAEEFPENEQSRATERSRQKLVNVLRAVTRPWLRIFSREQGRREAALFAQGSDAQLSVAETLKPLRSAVGQFSILAQDRKGIRKFVRAFAYFVRRTCFFRPCNMLLEKIIRISLTDACFPYTNGEFLKDSCGSPRVDKCVKAAKLDTKMGFSLLDNTCS